MRNPNRVKEILSIIERIWLRDPDMRFQQLIYVLQSNYSSANDGAGQIRQTTDDGFTRIGFDLFNTEDDDFLEFLKDYEVGLNEK